MKLKGDLAVLGGIRAQQYLTIDSTGGVTGSISSGGGGGGGDLIYQGITMNKMDPNYISNNYYEVDAGTITPGQINGQNGPVPGNWTSPFIIDNPNYNYNNSYITKNMKVKITNITDSTEYIGTIYYDTTEHFIIGEDNVSKIIYNFIDDNIDSPVQLSNTNSYKLDLLLYNIQPTITGSLDKNGYNGSSTGITSDYSSYTINAGGITPGQINSQAGSVPSTWTSPFIINNPNTNNNYRYITNNMKVEIIREDQQTVRGTLNFDTGYITESGKQIYNFTDDNTESPLILVHETSTYILTLLLSRVHTGGITPGQINSQAGSVPSTWTSPFIINDPNINNNSTYITNNMLIMIINTENGGEYIGTLNLDNVYITESGKQIYNFTDTNDYGEPLILYHETQTYEMFLFIDYQEPPVNSASSANNYIIITKSPLSINEYLNIKLNTNTYETDIPGIFKIFIINTANLNNTPQQFSYPPLYDDNGYSLSIETDTFINIFDGDQYILVTNFPIIQTNITIISYVSPQ